jgi:hypothetical protein
MLSKRRGIATEHMVGLSESGIRPSIGQSPYFDLYGATQTY